ncbi:MAG: peptide chain release factor-like protein, partial [Pseudomonadota bacterium]
FDASGRRHTSFASVFIFPELDDDIQVDINDKDLRIDTYRASGAGGQHVNKTSSAIRITHLPTGIVVQCQNERSQHRNKDTAMKMLKARLYDKERAEQKEQHKDIAGEKKEIAWGSQIRSYVMQPYRLIKDHRTNFEVGNVDSTLDGNLDPFIKAYLLWQR